MKWYFGEFDKYDLKVLTTVLILSVSWLSIWTIYYGLADKGFALYMSLLGVGWWFGATMVWLYEKRRDYKASKRGNHA